MSQAQLLLFSSQIAFNERALHSCRPDTVL